MSEKIISIKINLENAVQHVYISGHKVPSGIVLFLPSVIICLPCAEHILKNIVQKSVFIIIMGIEGYPAHVCLTAQFCYGNMFKILFVQQFYKRCLQCFFLFS